MTRKTKRAYMLTQNLLLLLVAVLVVSSCKDDNNTIPTEQYRLTTSVAPTVLDPSNPNNPYDVYGATHNGIILNFLNNSTYMGSNADTFKMEYYSLRLNYLITNNPYNINIEDYSALNTYNLEPFFDTTMYHHYYIDALTSLIGQINMENSIGVNNGLTVIRAFEGIILSDMTLTTDMKKMLLIRTSIARYSAVLWYEQFSNDNTVFFEYWEYRTDLSNNIAPKNSIIDIIRCFVPEWLVNDVLRIDSENFNSDFCSLMAAMDYNNAKKGLGREFE